MLEILDAALIAPIRWALLFVLELGHRATGSFGLALLMLSVSFNLLLMPAYHLAERMQAKERAVRRRMQPKIDEFTQVFKGQERYWMLRQLYRLHDYHPAMALRSVAPLAIQVPFFIAAYGLLSHHAPLQGQSFLWLPDLGRPDALLGGINLLPLVMTAVNLYALGIHTRNASRSEWLQGVVIALLFLLLLYDSPSGLVLYWTFNNLLSVAKSAWYARGQPRPAGEPSHLRAVTAEVAQGFRGGLSERLRAALSPGLPWTYAVTCAALFAFLVIALPVGLTSLEDNVDGLGGYVGFFLSVAAVMAVGFAAMCTVWYRVAPPAVRAWTTVAAFWLALLALVFAGVHQPDAGILDNFVFFKPAALQPSTQKALLDALILLGVTVLSLWVAQKRPAWVGSAMGVLLLASVIGAGVGMVSLDRRIEQRLAAGDKPPAALFKYSRTQPNVLLVFLDGAMSGYVPAALEDEPQLRQQLQGFSWYPNVVSSGNRTINGLPSVFGGPDYTVGGINARENGTLKEKVSDAYRVYVDNFLARGYQVQYADPFWFGLVRTGDCELFNREYAGNSAARCIHAIGNGVEGRKLRVTASRSGDFFKGLAAQYAALAVFRVAPQSLKAAVYDDGRWLSLSFAWKKRMDKYLNNFFSLETMPSLSTVDASGPTFNFVTNEAPRAPLLLDPGCMPLHAAQGQAPTRPHRFKDIETQKIFETHKCVLRGVGRLMDWLRAESIFDNTMVVLVSDHGWVSDNPLLDGIQGQRTFSMYQAFLMVKGFNSSGPLREDARHIANFNVPGILCETIGGCTDKATGRVIRDQPLRGPVTLYETPWQPAGQTLHNFVVEATHENSGPVGKQESWAMTPGRQEIAQSHLFADKARAMPWLTGDYK